VVFAYLAFQFPFTSASSTSRLFAKTINGTLQGVHSTSYSQDFSLTIPYAAPPIGHLRFNGPEPYDQKYDDRDSGHHGYNRLGCDQPSVFQLHGRLLDARYRSSIGSLVMVWIHGGGFPFGSGIDSR